MTALKIRKGDTVQVLAGKDRGKRGKVLRVLPETHRIVVEGLNIRKKHTRPRKQGEKGQIVEFPATMPVGRASLVCPHCQKTLRVGFRMNAEGKKTRWCRKCQSVITP